MRGFGVGWLGCGWLVGCGAVCGFGVCGLGMAGPCPDQVWTVVGGVFGCFVRRGLAELRETADVVEGGLVSGGPWPSGG